MRFNGLPNRQESPAGYHPAWGILLCLLVLVAAPLSGQEPRKEVIRDLKEWPMYSSPTIGRSTEKIVHSPELIPLWMAALKSEELDLQRQAADTIVIARRAGVEGLEKMIPTLMEIARHPEPHPTVLAAVCRALIALDHRPAAPRLLELVKQDQLLLCQLIEPGLTDWKDPGAIQVWRTRLEQPGRSLPLSLLAVRSLGQVEDHASVEALVSLAVNPSLAVSLRIEAAREAGRLAPGPRISSVETLRAAGWDGNQRWFNRLVAAWLLFPPPATEAQQQQVLPLAMELALDEEGSVAAVALGSLMSWNVEQVAGLAAQVASHPHAQVRATIAQALLEQINPARVSQLVGFLEDPYEPTRLMVRDGLVELLADETVGPAVAEELVSVRPDLSWRGMEQLLKIMVAVPRVADEAWITTQINHPRPEVFIPAAWAVRRLRITAALPVMLIRVRAAEAQMVNLNLDLSPYLDDVMEQVCHIFQAFGEMKYKPAERMVVKSIALNSPFYPFQVRASAAWAIGIYYEGNPDKRIVGILEARVAHELPQPPEGMIVKRMSAISLARMNSVESIPLLEQYYYSSPAADYLKWTCAWALSKLGKEMDEKPTTFAVFSSNWFLEPIHD
jgi:HEAT repeat protein